MKKEFKYYRNFKRVEGGSKGESDLGFLGFWSKNKILIIVVKLC